MGSIVAGLVWNLHHLNFPFPSTRFGLTLNLNSPLSSPRRWLFFCDFERSASLVRFVSFCLYELSKYFFLSFNLIFLIEVEANSKNSFIIRFLNFSDHSSFSKSFVLHYPHRTITITLGWKKIVVRSGRTSPEGDSQGFPVKSDSKKLAKRGAKSMAGDSIRDSSHCFWNRATRWHK